MGNMIRISETGQRSQTHAKRFSSMRLSERTKLVTSFGSKVLDKYAKMAEQHSKVEHTVLPLGAQGMGIFVPPRGSNSLSPVLRRMLTDHEPNIEPMLAVKFCDDKVEMTFHPAYAPLVELIRQAYYSRNEGASWKERLGLDLKTSAVEVKR